MAPELPLRRLHLALLLLALIARAATPAAAQPGIGGCVMGTASSGTGGQNGLYGFGLIVYQWFDPTTCGFCLSLGGAIELRTVEMRAYAGTDGVAVTIPAIVSVVGWKGSAACPEPDDAVVLLAPQNVAFQVPAGPLPLAIDIRVPVAQSPQFLSPAFLRLEILPTPTTFMSPALFEIVAPTCESCRPYVSSPIPTGGRLVDACSGGVVNPWALHPRGD